MTDMMPMTTAQALDAAFAGEFCELVRADGLRRPLAAHRWSGPASESDLRLFVEPSTGRTLDLGCGPGRLAGALWSRGVDVLGVDISPEAVRQTQARGAPALCRDAFDDLPGALSWEHVLLADGNIGLGGRPVSLLRRVTALLSPRGNVLVELAGDGTLCIHHGMHLQVGDRASGCFDWATVGVDAIVDVAGAAGLRVAGLVSAAGRHVAILERPAGTVGS